MNKKETQFVQTVTDFYTIHGRHTLPWRKTKDPYKILVSEIMLQQTQVDRVVPKYKVFLKIFPNFRTLAEASLGEVLTQWQGLGYNRRAKMLHTCAKEVMSTYKGSYPDTFQESIKLPGVGPYTAGAVLAFAFNEPVTIIETNIRTVYIHHFFSKDTDVTDAEILLLVKKTLDTEKPREWYWALMDYGSYLKKEYGSFNSKSKHYIKQSKFKGSDRQIRGAVIRMLTEGTCLYSRKKLLKKLSHFEDIRIDAQLEKLLKEGMIVKTKQNYHLPNNTL